MCYVNIQRYCLIYWKRQWKYHLTSIRNLFMNPWSDQATFSPGYMITLEVYFQVQILLRSSEFLSELSSRVLSNNDNINPITQRCILFE